MSEEMLKREELVADPFLVVGVGASAGGLDAFKQFVSSIPKDSGIAYVLVQHLDPTHNSILPELLQQVTAIPVHEITDNISVKPDNIYVVPPSKVVVVKPGVLTLTDRLPKNLNELPIDLFLKSLAEVYQTQAIGVVLSGTGNDGSLGLKAIKHEGGITFAQHHHSAGYNEMPQNAINAKVVDFVLPPEGIIHQLLEFNVLFKENLASEKDKEEKPEDISFKKILNIVDLQKGVDFTYYKQSTLRRRIARRIVLRNFANIQDYLKDLTTNPAEVENLYKDLLIPVTEFFRDTNAFNYLTTVGLPLIVKSSTTRDLFRAWSVGCSTGQEAYSMAICLYEYFSTQSRPIKIQVFATDISDTSIAQARSGFYSNDEVASVSPERLEKFFIKADGGYQVNKVIRDICVFAAHNLLTSPPFAGMHLISCRNVLIYMEPFLQRKAMATFHYSLNEKGMLFLGKSESIGSSSDLFSPLSDTDKFFSRSSVPGRFVHISGKRRAEFFDKGLLPKGKENRAHDDFEKSADELVLQRAPAGVVVNDQFDILQFRGATGEWLEPAPGKPSVNVLKMCKHGLSVDVRSALHKVKASQTPFIKEGIVIDTGGIRKIVTLEVIPIVNTINLYFLILFKNSLTLPLSSGKPVGKGKNNGSENIRTLQLEKELLQTRADMRTITEDQEVGNEELLSANEELLSGSEELRSLNEELEISKEELQSTVEELSVANQELTFRNDELTYARKYSDAIITTISEPLLVLNQELKINSANDAFFSFFDLTERDAIGKNFFELDDHQWEIPELKRIIDRTMADSTLNVVFELKREFKRIGEQIILIRCRKVVRESTAEPFLLLIIENITERKHNEELAQMQAEYSRAVLDSNPIITFTASAEGSITYSNKVFLDYSGLKLEEAISLGWAAVIHPDQNDIVTKTWLDAVARDAYFNMEILLKRHDGVYRWHSSHALPLRDAQGKITSWVCSCSDIHDRKMFSEELERQINERTQALKEANNALEHSNKNLEQFAFIASHDLQEPLRKIQTFSNILVENFRTGFPEDGQKLVEKIQMSSARLSLLIQDVLNFSRIQSSENLFKTTDLNKVFGNVLGDFSLLIEEKRASVKVENLPTIEAIPIQINQLFYNLLSNSLKFSITAGTPTITVSSRKLTKVEVLKFASLNAQLEYFDLQFADNGIGFDPIHKEKIFEIFQRLHQRDEYSGTGIGLALCRKIVVNHKGLLFADSQPGVGSLFHIILPLNEHHTAIELLPGYAE